MPPPDVSWLYEKEMKVDLLQRGEEEEEGDGRGGMEANKKNKIKV